MNPSYQELDQYTHYLESQLEKFSAFMITQKKLNEKHIQIQTIVDEIIQKIDNFEEKFKLIEINQKDNLYQLKKMRASNEAFKTMEIRIQNIQHQISSFFRSQVNVSPNISSENSLIKSTYKKNLFQSQKSKKTQNRNFKMKFSQQNLEEITKYLSSTFIEKHEVQETMKKAKDEIEFKIKKLQMQIQKSKESFLKLTAHVNNLSNQNHFESPLQKQLKGQKRFQTQSTKDLNIEPVSNQNTITKKDFKKMQKKLENFFMQKLQEIKSQSQYKQTQSNMSQKGLRFKRIQQKYDKLTADNTHHPNRSERKIGIEDRRSSSQKKISLFENEILKERHVLENFVSQNKSKSKKKSKNNVQNPIFALKSPKNRNSINNSQSQQKKMMNKKSPERIKKVNTDYMISQ